MQVKHLLLIAILALTAACSSNETVDENLGEVELYQQAQADLDNKSYTSAISKLKALESRYPFGRFAEQAQLELIYAYFRSGQPEAARASADRFIRLHPQHANADYAYYLKAMVSFQEDKNFLEVILPINPAHRDITRSREAFDFFDDLINQFPDSKYAPDAKQRMVYLRNLMAEHELEVARYYIKRGAFVRSIRQPFRSHPSHPQKRERGEQSFAPWTCNP